MNETVRLVAKSVVQRAEDYKNSVEAIITKYNKQLQDTDEELQEILEQLDRQQCLNKEAVSLIARVSDEMKRLEVDNIHMEESIKGLKNELWVTRRKVSEMEQSRNKLEQELEQQKKSNRDLEKGFQEAHAKMAEIEMLTKKVTALQEEGECCNKKCEMYLERVTEYEKEIQELSSINKDFSERCGQYGDLFTKCKILEDRNVELEKTILQSEQLIDPFRSQLEAYSVEKQKIEEASTDVETEAAQAELKYTEIIKHQTEKKKIMDMIDLKERKLELVKRRLRVATILTESEDTHDDDD